MRIFCTVMVLLSFIAPHSAHSATLPGIPEFIEEMVAKHKFERDKLENAFAHAHHLPVVIEAISRPSTFRPWPEYRASFVNQQRIKRGLEFWNKYRQTLSRAEKQYGVPQEIIVAVIGVETIYGRNAGKFRVMDALTTLAFDYPRRADFFRSELENYLLLAREQHFNLFAIRGSYAGALGVPQFMPSSYRKFAVDFNGNRRIDLLREDRDAIGSVANYLQSYGWIRNDQIAVRAHIGDKVSTDDSRVLRSIAEWAGNGVVADSAPEKVARLIDFTVEDGKEYWLTFNNFEIITHYNNSDYYAMSVFQLAEELKAERYR